MLCCSKCGAKAKASCQCDAAYVPASKYAARAVAAHPEKSDRAIAAAIGVDHKTVAKARKSVGEKSPTRVGADGKRYLSTKRMTPEMANAMRARAEAVTAMFGDVRRIPGGARAELVAALDAYAPPLVEVIRKRLNMSWNELLVPADENESPLEVAPAQRPKRIAAAA